MAIHAPQRRPPPRTPGRTPGRTLALACALACALALAAGCNGDGDKPDGSVADGAADQFIGTRPPDITQCHKPPNMYSKTLYYCQCTGWLNGGPPTAACNGMTGDCRFFYDGCFPDTYTKCDQSAPDNILGLCGDCFFRDSGTIPPHCDRLSDDDLGTTPDT